MVLIEYLRFRCLILKHLIRRLIQVIDGPSGILGQAGPLLGRPSDENGKLTVVTGNMEFDKDDIAGLVADGTWNGVILHEMAHVFGIGTTWALNGLVTSELQYLGAQGISVWEDDWGCDSSPPVETDGGPGTAGSHWDENCLQDELMTGFVDDSMPLSKLTIANLHDSGYEVDYSVADAYDGSDTTCCFSSGSIASVAASKSSNPQPSDEAMAAAVAYGRRKLNENQPPSSLASGELSDNGYIYLGDLVTVVLFQENGHIFDVHVTKE